MRFLGLGPGAGEEPRKIDVNDVFHSVAFTLLPFRDSSKKTKTGPWSVLGHPPCLRRSFQTSDSTSHRSRYGEAADSKYVVCRFIEIFPGPFGARTRPLYKENENKQIAETEYSVLRKQNNLDASRLVIGQFNRVPSKFFSSFSSR